MSIRSNPDRPQDELFRSRLENMIDMNHPLVKLGQGIDWEVFDREFGKHYAANVGRPATRTRLIVGLTYLQFMYDNPYDGHTLEEAFDQIKAITDHIPKQVYVDRGYRAAYLGQQTDVIITGQKRHSKATKRWMKRRNSVEPIIGHLKAGHKMQRNWLKGHLGDIMAPVLAASGFNLKKILRALALFAPKTYELIMALLADFYTKLEKSSQHHRQINGLLAV